MPGDSSSDVPSAVFGRYRALHHLGVGSLGPVFHGDASVTGEPVAIHTLRLSLTDDVASRAAAELSSLATRVPRHSAIVPVIDAGVSDGDVYVVTAPLTGEPLDHALAEYGPATADDALPRLRRIAGALDAAAAAGVPHGALTLRDVFVSADATAIVGVGVADALTRAGVEIVERRGDVEALASIARAWIFDAQRYHAVLSRRHSSCGALIDALERGEMPQQLALVDEAADDDFALNLDADAPPVPDHDIATSALSFSVPDHDIATSALSLSVPDHDMATPSPQLPVPDRDIATSASRFSVATLLIGVAIGAAVGYYAGYVSGDARARVLAPTGERGVTETAVAVDPPPAASAPSPAPPPVTTAVADANDKPAAEPAPAKRVANTKAARRRSGSLVIVSRPSGGRVTINGKQQGSTPLTVASLPPGSHRVRIERRGYRPWTTTVKVTEGARARVAASLVGGRSKE